MNFLIMITLEVYGKSAFEGAFPPIIPGFGGVFPIPRSCQKSADVTYPTQYSSLPSQQLISPTSIIARHSVIHQEFSEHQCSEQTHLRET